MRAPLAALAIAVVALASAAAPAAGDGDGPILVADPDEPGPNLPPVGRSLFDELYGVGPPAASPADGARHAIPFPFERLLADLNARIAPAEARTVLVPLGRSLQRHAADPDYFASPRIVVAIDDDGAGAGGPLLRDRLYLGYHERAGVIEVISYNEDAGRFEFQVVEGYGPGRLPRVEYAERSICVTCHQGHAPIFATALWSETNADPRVAARLAAELGAAFHGAPVRRGVDVADALDRSTDRANRLAFANFAWTHGCGGPEEPEAAARCRGDLLLAVLRYRLGGARGAWRVDGGGGSLAAPAARLARAAPAGLGVPSPDLPNRDPLAEIEAGTSAPAAVDPDGVFEPTLPRAPVPLWRPTEPDADGAPVAAIVRALGAFFSRADVARLDARLLALAAADREPVAAYRARCRAQPVDFGGDLRELRLACGDGVTDVGRMLSLTGHVTLADGAPTGGLVRSLAVGGHAPVHRLTVTGGALTRHGRAATLELRLGEAALGLSARLATGERLTPMAVRLGDDGAAAVEIGTVDDLGPLRDAIGRLVEAATTAGGGAAALGSGPLRRRAVLAELDAALAAN